MKMRAKHRMSFEFGYRKVSKLVAVLADLRSNIQSIIKKMDNIIGADKKTSKALN